MNPYVFQCECSICGEVGVYHARYGAGAGWLESFTHSDPRVCKANLEAQQRKAERQEREKATQSVEEGSHI